MSIFGSDASAAQFRQPPLEVAPETFVIRAATASGGGSATSLNAMLIRGREPVVVDTGMVTDRETWFADLFSLVEPDELRWIFVTHNDSDHSGNLVEALERCPNARVVTSRAESFRTAASFGIPFERMRLVDAGEAFAIGDRRLRAIRPPVYDSPYTRGLYDPVTRLYYASDAFCAPMPDGPVDRVDEIAPDAWAEGMARHHHHSLCPWIALVDQPRFEAEVARLAALDIEVIVSAHSAAICGRRWVETAFSQLAALPSTVPPPNPLAAPPADQPSVADPRASARA